MMYFYFYLISLSLIGYGILANKILKINNFCFGVLGLLGITFLTLISYFSSIFFVHNYIFNTSILFLGLFTFILNIKNFRVIKKDLIVYTFSFTCLLIFITIGKNHDDFAYYHFPYILLLTEYTHPIGLGQLNNGFRSPSSIFFVSSMFYLPKISHYITHFTPALILGFSNIIFYKFIFNRNFYEQFKFLNFLALISFCFVNIFFYRLAEHGTDRSGMIIILVSIIILFQIMNYNKISKLIDISSSLKFFSILICFVVSIKPFYLIYFLLFLIIFCFKHSRQVFFGLFFSKSFFYCCSLIFFTIFFTFLNSGCFIFPVALTCFENLTWSIGSNQASDVKIWFELWSKAGASPNYIVNDRLIYINNLNWLQNWINNYFFNKVSDFLLGILFLISILAFFFFEKNLSFKKKKVYFKLLYLILLIFLFEWFFFHPALRYGGYHIIALILFIPLCVFLENAKLSYRSFVKKTITLCMITLIIFFIRNITRLNKEYKNYNYNPLVNTNFKYIGGNKDFFFRYNDQLKKYFNKYPKLNFFGKEIIIITK